MAGPGIYLLDYFPRAGFRWRRGQGSPRILRSNKRDAGVQRALIDLLSRDGSKIRKRDVQSLVVDALTITAKSINDVESGIRPSEGIIDFLERSANLAKLPQAIPEDVWVELVYQIAHARNEYKRHTPKAQQEGDADRLTALSFAIDDLVRAAGHHWDWMALEFYVYPHLMGEAVDYEVDDDVSGGESEDEKMDMSEDDDDLPKRMEDLAIVDGNGDMEMTM